VVPPPPINAINIYQLNATMNNYNQSSTNEIHIKEINPTTSGFFLLHYSKNTDFLPIKTSKIGKINVIGGILKNSSFGWCSSFRAKPSSSKAMFQ
jgi:hypothetical protein